MRLTSGIQWGSDKTSVTLDSLGNSCPLRTLKIISFTSNGTMIHLWKRNETHQLDLTIIIINHITYSTRLLITSLPSDYTRVTSPWATQGPFVFMLNGLLKSMKSWMTCTQVWEDSPSVQMLLMRNSNGLSMIHSMELICRSGNKTT